MNLWTNPFVNITELSTSVILMKALLAVFLSFVLSSFIAYVYKKTFQGTHYSQSFVHTIIMMSVVVSVIMIVIGNNVAVAFGLVGAFSIIRFRSAMNDPKDIAFIFFGMAAGISCGLGFYMLAVLFTLTLCLFIYLLFAFNYGKSDSTLKSLIVNLPENVPVDDLFQDIFAEYVESHRLLQIETTNLGTMLQVEYEIRTKEGKDDKSLIDAIRQRNANLKVSIGYPREGYKA